MSEINLCMTCSAYCAYSRVSFYWAEADDTDSLVPSALTEPLIPFLRRMSDTNQRQSRCTALSGDTGDAVHCTIYENRPLSCCEFAMSGESGEENDACNRARARYGLPPLRSLYKDIPALSGTESATRERFAVQSSAN